jgi:hypothetical protein
LGWGSFVGVRIIGSARPHKTSATFYAWVGRCIKEWAAIEQDLYGIFRSAVASPHKPVAAAIYWNAPTVDARIRLITAVLSARIYPNGKPAGSHGPKEFDDWQKLVNRAQPLGEFRNFLAHSPAHWSAELGPRKRGSPYKVVGRPIYYTGQIPDDAARKKSKFHGAGIAEMRAKYTEFVEFRSNLHETHIAMSKLLASLGP